MKGLPNSPVLCSTVVRRISFTMLLAYRCKVFDLGTEPAEYHKLLIVIFNELVEPLGLLVSNSDQFAVIIYQVPASQLLQANHLSNLHRRSDLVIIDPRD